MSRPKMNERETSAVYKIETAFWALIEQKDFSDITMQLLAKEAGINRNSLYYHYANLYEVAFQAFNEVVSDEASMVFMFMFWTLTRLQRQQLWEVFSPELFPRIVLEVVLEGLVR